MKTRTLLLLVTATLSLGSLRANPPTGVNAFCETSPPAVGSPVALEGIVHRVSAERRLVSLVDKSEKDCTDACTPKTVHVLVPNPDQPLPAKGEVVLVRGTVDATGSTPRVSATSIEQGS